MSEIRNVITEDWSGHSHGEVEDALKGKLSEMDQSIEEAAQAGYAPPDGGIPKNDLAQTVQDSLDNADSAVQDSQYVHTDNNFTDSEKAKLSGLQNYDDSALANRVSQLENAGYITEDDLPEGATFDDALSDTSENGVQNKVVKAAIDSLQSALNTLIGSGNVQGAIDTFNEVKAFLAGIDTSDPTLFNQLKSLSDAITTLQNTLSSKANAADVVKGIRAYGSSTNLPKSNDGIITLPEISAPDLSGYATTTAMNQAIEDKLTDVTVAAVGSDASFFIRDGALCISTENFVTVTETPTITTAIQSDGTCLVTIAKNSNTEGSPTILYSTDGSTPDTEYTDPFYIDEAGTYTIKATAQVSGKPKSDEATASVTVSESSAPTITIEKTSSAITITASGGGTVVLKVDGNTVANPYTVNRTSSNQTLSVEATNKENNKLIKSVTQTITVPKLTVISVKIRNFVKRVVDAGGHLIFGEPSNFDWSTVTSAEWAEGYDDTTDPSNPTFDQTQVTNADLLAVLEATQEKYDEHTELLGCEPSLDFLGYTGTRDAPTKLMSVDQTLDAGSLSRVIITNDGLISATASITGSSANIIWSQFTGAYGTRMAASINGTLTDFNSIYLYATPVTPNVEDGFINPSKSESNYYYKNGIFEGFINASAQPGCTGRTDGYLSFVAKQSNFYAQYYAPYIESIHVDRSSGMITTINGSIATALSSEERLAMEVGSVTHVAYAYMQMKANCPMLVLAGVKSS